MVISVIHGVQSVKHCYSNSGESPMFTLFVFYLVVRVVSN